VMPEPKLKPCPFCGNTGVVQRKISRAAWLIYCPSEPHICPVSVETVWFESEERAASAWNTRPLETQMYEALKSLVDAGSCTCMNQSDDCCLIASGRAALAQADGK
jgi:hypothetical protein